MVTGRPTPRTPDELEPGDCTLLPSGQDGAHKITNRSGDTARVLLVSNFAQPRAAVQVGQREDDAALGARVRRRRWFFLGDVAGYFDDEPEG